ncbi:hypothetical protein J2S41_005896 [Catenuloplanes atrovinosus]|uniref:CHAT domain-containing protein n=1 Tax=Catenuloplanes atrovinosus TaxID=137266 RepID=A0AAE4CCF1_9ACTN|nr:hypothetical protein [Catenuloplanes atrovinosus]
MSTAVEETLRRCGEIALAVSGHGDLDAALACYLGLPPDLPGRPRFAAALVAALVREPTVAPARMRQLEALLAAADADPPAAPSWPAVRAVAGAVSLTYAAAEGRVDPRAALADVERLAEQAGGSPLFETSRMGLRYVAAAADGDASAHRRMTDELTALWKASGAAAKDDGGVLEVLDSVAALLETQRRGEVPDAPLSRLRTAVQRLPEGHPMRQAATEAYEMASALSGGGPMPSMATHEEDLPDAERALRHGYEAMRLLGRGDETDLGKVEAGIEHLRMAVRLTPAGHSRRPFHLASIALGLYRGCELRNDPTGLEEARGLLEEARDLAGGPAHPQWSWINDMLSGIEQRLGGAQRSRRTALEGLRGHAYQVLLQTDLTSATSAAADAARDAADTARWCLRDNAPADAITALDAGRGLALFAATELGTIPDRMRAAGRDDLADRWDAGLAAGEPDRLPTSLRREALDVLAAQDVPALLDPPDLDEIRAALRTQDADALVYLMPGGQGLPGHAVIAPVDGPPAFLTLPNLLPADVDVESYLALSARGPRDMDAADDERFAGSLDALCRWAWRAAMGPLVNRYLLPRFSGRSRGRPPRVVLVPIGDLARIPWQAARRPDGTYVVQLIGVSQAVSARMMCHTAALAPVTPTPTGLFVGDPATGDPRDDLPAARAEAYAVRRVFYSGARYVGRRPDGTVSPSGPGTADQVRGWLRTGGPAAGSTLHLACHGFTSATPGAELSYLMLAGGDRLTAQSLGAVMSRAPDRAVGLVVLAACRSGVAISGYDEAYSLGTAFLAAGARSVLSTQWNIPDGATSVLMFMFHHYLMAERLPVWDALRRAQLWMLDPGRIAPARMPDSLRAELAGADPADVVAWAGFLHWGR